MEETHTDGQVAHDAARSFCGQLPFVGLAGMECHLGILAADADTGVVDCGGDAKIVAGRASGGRGSDEVGAPVSKRDGLLIEHVASRHGMGYACDFVALEKGNGMIGLDTHARETVGWGSVEQETLAALEGHAQGVV